MGRQIKFRAWVKRVGGHEFGRMAKVIGMYGNYNSAHVRGIDCAIDDLVSVDDIELMQFTGLEDIDKIEIYEGDIVSVYSAYDEHRFKGVVGFSDASFMIKNDACTYYRWMDYEVEVLGNIYENSELLEG